LPTQELTRPNRFDGFGTSRCRGVVEGANEDSAVILDGWTGGAVKGFVGDAMEARLPAGVGTERITSGDSREFEEVRLEEVVVVAGERIVDRKL
jgi:hypothetical protein